MNVIAKFTCNSIVKRIYAGCEEGEYSIDLYPVTSGSEEDKAFWLATPAGKIELHVVNEKAAQYFKPGKTYYVTFESANEGSNNERS